MPDARKIALIGVPSSAGGRKVGQELGPKALRDAGLVLELESGGHDVLDLGDVPEAVYAPDPLHPRQQNLPKVLDILGQVESKVESAMVRCSMRKTLRCSATASKRAVSIQWR